MRKDYLIENLSGMCAHNRTTFQDVRCSQTVRSRAEYCTACEAAERLKESSALLNAYREVLQELQRAFAFMTREQRADLFPDWFKPRVDELLAGGNQEAQEHAKTTSASAAP